MQLPSLFTTLALVASALAADSKLTITSPSAASDVHVGQNLTIEWTSDYPNTTKVDVILIGGGDPSTLEECGYLAYAINDSGSMWWDVEGYKPFSGEWSCPLAWKHTYPDTIFGIKIVTDHGAVHYSEPFHIII